MIVGVLARFFFFQAEDGIRDFCLSRGLGDVYKRQRRARAPSPRRRVPCAGSPGRGTRACVMMRTAAPIRRLTPRCEAGAVKAMRHVLAVVIAGGAGERLSVLSAIRSKPAVPFGGKFRLIDFSLSNCANSDIEKVLVLTQYNPRSLIDHIR